MDETMKLALIRTRRMLRTMNYPLLACFSFIISALGMLMILGYHPENASLGVIPIFEFVFRFAFAIASLTLGMGVIAIFLEAYRPLVEKKLEDKRNYLLSVIEFLKNIRLIMIEHTDVKEYKNKLFENMLTNEKPSVWKWFGMIFGYTQKHINDQNKINEETKEKLQEHGDLIKEILKKKNVEIDSKNKTILRLRKALERYQKKYPLDKYLESDFQDD